MESEEAIENLASLLMDLSEYGEMAENQSPNSIVCC